MTKNEIHRRALLTAAKLSLFAAGCGATEGAVTTTEGTTASTSMATADVAKATPGSAQAPTAAAPVVTVAPFGVADTPPKSGCHLPVYSLPTDKDISCCDGVVAAAFPDGGGFGKPASDPAPQLVACCGVVVDYYDHHGGEAAAAGHTLPWNVRQSCCSVLHPPPSGPTCTPWGPPAPPAMPIGWA